MIMQKYLFDIKLINNNANQGLEIQFRIQYFKRFQRNQVSSSSSSQAHQICSRTNWTKLQCSN
jgi:hypothetical protein